MANIFKNIITLLAALVGFAGGVIWAVKCNWEPEPIILIIISSLELIGFVFYRYLEAPVDKKTSVKILFIDDKHSDFKMVSILKKSGWTNTKSVKDITDLGDPRIIEADIIFVDINGVGISMFEDQGLGLASALKKKYMHKKIVLYSAETKGDRFHNAIREVDSCLPKNAEPYQFIKLIESLTSNNR